MAHNRPVTDPQTARLTCCESVVIQITRGHHIAQARRAAAALARKIGFPRVTIYYIATSVSELADNLFFHADRGGSITLTAIQHNGQTGIEVIAEDEGPGIPDLELAMQDGFSTDGGLGGGLPGTRRLMDEFEITSTVGAGTRVVARKWRTCP